MGGGWSTPCPSCFTPQERPGTHCIGGWVGPRAGLDRSGNSRPPPSGFHPWTVQLVASRYTDRYSGPHYHQGVWEILITLHEFIPQLPKSKLIRLGHRHILTFSFVALSWSCNISFLMTTSFVWYSFAIVNWNHIKQSVLIVFIPETFAQVS